MTNLIPVWGALPCEDDPSELLPCLYIVEVGTPLHDTDDGELPLGRYVIPPDDSYTSDELILPDGEDTDDVYEWLEAWELTSSTIKWVPAPYISAYLEEETILEQEAEQEAAQEAAATAALNALAQEAIALGVICWDTCDSDYTQLIGKHADSVGLVFTATGESGSRTSVGYGEGDGMRGTKSYDVEEEYRVYEAPNGDRLRYYGWMPDSVIPYPTKDDYLKGSSLKWVKDNVRGRHASVADYLTWEADTIASDVMPAPPRKR
jgi:hypothetical protein